MNIQGIFISFRIDWFELLVVQRTLKSLLQNQFESRNSSVLSLLYEPTLGSVHDYSKNHGFEYTEFVGKVVSLLPEYYLNAKEFKNSQNKNQVQLFLCYQHQKYHKILNINNLAYLYLINNGLGILKRGVFLFINSDKGYVSMKMYTCVWYLLWIC